MADFFISYSRKDKLKVEQAARLLTELGYSVWIDEHKIPPSADWWEETKAAIREALSFLAFVSESSASSVWCQRELEHALENGKKIISVSLQDFNGFSVPAELLKPNAILMHSDDVEMISLVIKKIVDAHKTDFAWVTAHTWLQDKAFEWHERGEDTGLLLRGKQLESAEHLLASSQGVDKDPPPTQLQHIFLKQSRGHATVILRRIISAVSLALLVTAILAIVAVIQSRLALRQSDLSESLALAALGERALADGNYELAIALAVEAVQIQDPPSQSVAALNRIVFSPGTRTVIPDVDAFRVSFSPDDKTIASGSSTAEVALYDSETGNILCTLGDHGRYESGLRPLTHAISFTPDGRTLLTNGIEYAIVWDVSTCSEIDRIQLRPEHTSETAAFSLDGRLMLLGTRFGTVSLWDVEAGTKIVDFDGSHETVVKKVAISPSGNQAASGGEDNRVFIWDFDCACVTKILQGDKMYGLDYGQIWELAFSPNGELLATGNGNGVIQVWDLDSGEEILKIDLHITGSVQAIEFSPDGFYLALAGWDNTVKVWDLTSNQLLHHFSGAHTAMVTDIDFDSTGSRIVTASLDRTIRIFDLVEGPQREELVGHTARVRRLEVSADGRYLLSSSFDGSIRLWDLVTNSEIWRFKPPTADMQVIGALSPDAKNVLIYSSDQLRVVDIETNEVLKVLSTSLSQVLDLGYISSGDYIYALEFQRIGIAETMVRVWNLESEDEYARLFDIGTNTYTVANVSISGPLMAIGSAHGDMPQDAGQNAFSLWNWQEQKKIFQFPQNKVFNMIIATAFDPDGKYVLSATLDNNIQLFETASGSLVNEYKGHSASVTNVKFLPDGQRFVSSSGDGTVRVWRKDTSHEMNLFAFGEPVRSLALKDDSRQIIVGTEGGRIVLVNQIETVDDVLRWAAQNRYIREISCEEQLSLGLLDCREDQFDAAALDDRSSAVTEVTTDNSPAQDTSPGVLLATTSGLYSGRGLIWFFDLNAGDSIDLSLESDQFDPYLVLHAPNGKVLLANDDAYLGTNTAHIAGFVAPSSGRYFVVGEQFCFTCPTNDQMQFSLSLTSDSVSLTEADLNFERAPAGIFGYSYEQIEGEGNIVEAVVKGSGAELGGLLAGD